MRPHHIAGLVCFEPAPDGVNGGTAWAHLEPCRHWICETCYLKAEHQAVAAAAAVGTSDAAWPTLDEQTQIDEDVDAIGPPDEQTQVEEDNSAAEEEQEELTQGGEERSNAGASDATSGGTRVVVRRPAVRLACPAGCLVEVAFVRFTESGRRRQAART